jgi:ketosteroid isomerase-like protein
MKVTITTEMYKIIQTGDIVLYNSKWSAVGTAPDGAPLKMGGTSSVVLHRQVDGRWLIAIDNPFGAAILN